MSEQFYIIENGNGKLVESWSFSYSGSIVFCQTPEWAIKFATKEQAQKRLDYLNKQNFANGKGLKITKLSKELKYYEEN